MPGEVEVEKPQEEATPDEAAAAGEKPTKTPAPSKSVVGIIYPPPEVRSILHTEKRSLVPLEEKKRRDRSSEYACFQLERTISYSVHRPLLYVLHELCSLVLCVCVSVENRRWFMCGTGWLVLQQSLQLPS